MAIAFVQENGKSTAVASSDCVVTFTNGASAGNFVCCIWRHSNTRHVSSVTDSAGNTWNVSIYEVIEASANYGIAWSVLSSAKAASSTITLVWDGSSYAYQHACLLEFSGVASSPYDTHATNMGYGTAFSCPITTAEAGELIVGSYAHRDSTYTAGSGYNLVSNQYLNNRSEYVYGIVGAAGSHDPDGSVVANENVYAIFAAFKAASSGLSIPVAMASYRRRRM